MYLIIICVGRQHTARDVQYGVYFAFIPPNSVLKKLPVMLINSVVGLLKNNFARLFA